MYYVYVLVNEKGQSYTGYTASLSERLAAHNLGKSAATRGHKWELVYCEAYKAEKDARLREQQLKKSGQARRWLRERIANSLVPGKES